jgi:pimeloyl-ACP methyl ester carboxylesterase
MGRKSLISFISLSLAVTAGYLYGMLSFRNQLPPYHLVREIYEGLFSIRLDIEPLYSAPSTPTDAEAIISIHTRDDVYELRKRLIAFLWGAPGMPEEAPSEVHTGIADDQYQRMANLDRIDELVVRMEYGIESHIYHFIPKEANNKVILYHQGHDGDFYRSKDRIAVLVARGYSVVTLAMPLLGLNNQPTVFLPRLGWLKLTMHDHMKFLQPACGHPVRYFVEPVVVALNYLEHQYHYNSIDMIGRSGGGWVATVAAALDPRIRMSFPVAASYPIHLRSESEWGDWEQTDPALYTTVNYLEMYILGAYGTDRKQLQVVNKYDPCCFAGLKWETYKDPVQRRMAALGAGAFDVFLDDTHRDHILSEAAMNRMLQELENTAPLRYPRVLDTRDDHQPHTGS